MAVDDSKAGLAMPEDITALADGLGIDLVGIAAEDAAGCEARLDAMSRILEARAPGDAGDEQDIPVIEWTVDYVLPAVLGLGSPERETLLGRYAGIMTSRWDGALLRILPLQTVKARLLSAALDGKELTDSQVKMLRFKYKRSMEGLGNR